MKLLIAKLIGLFRRLRAFQDVVDEIEEKVEYIGWSLSKFSWRIDVSECASLEFTGAFVLTLLIYVFC